MRACNAASDEAVFINSPCIQHEYASGAGMEGILAWADGTYKSCLANLVLKR